MMERMDATSVFTCKRREKTEERREEREEGREKRGGRREERKESGRLRVVSTNFV